MNKFLLSAAILFTMGMLAQAADDGQPDPKGEAKPAEQPSPTSQAGEGPADTGPWNPELKFANEWPYTQAVHIDTEFYGPPGDFWVTTEYLLWWLKGAAPPPLVTTGPVASEGVLGQPGTAVLFGGSSPDLNPFSGARITAGTWFDSAYTLGIEGNYFFLSQRSGNFLTSSTGSPLLAVPFINAVTGQPDSAVFASPGVSSAGIIVQSPTELQGAEANLVWNVRTSKSIVFDLLLGFRWLDLGSDLNILYAITEPGASATAFDQFTVHNDFFGGQIGARVTYRWGPLEMGLSEKLALGGNHANIAIMGATNTTIGGVTTQTPGGLFAEPSNIGTHTDDTFSVVNEVGVQAGWRFCDYCKAFVGYTFLYASSVVRAADIVDTTVNTNPTAGGPDRPIFTRQQTDFWANGLNVGVEVRY